MKVIEENNEKIYIAGAHSRAQTLRVYLQYLYPETEIVAYLVDDMSENASEVGGIPVCLIQEGLHSEYPVYIGTRSVNHPKLTQELRDVGFTEIIPVTVELDMQLRNAYLRKFYAERGEDFVVIDDLEAGECAVEKSARIYVASTVFDKPLQSDYSLLAEEAVLQVGAALTRERIAECVLTDCTGENISEKNRQYCELTGLYWLWKHAQEDYIGLVHYRRHFLLPEDWLTRMEENGVDVILPVPLYVAPSIEGNYKSRHLAEDWDFLMVYFRENLPDEYETMRKVFAGNLYSPCNMFIMRREVLKDFCGWMFPILEAVVAHGGEKEDAYMNRYPGFISERLITYFFESRSNQYNVIYANKNFLM